LHAANGDDGPAIGLVCPELFGPLNEGELSFEPSGLAGVLLENSQFERSDLGRCIAVDPGKGGIRGVAPVSQEQYSRRLGQPVHQTQLNN
jgi:hypothetical protein